LSEVNLPLKSAMRSGGGGKYFLSALKQGSSPFEWCFYLSIEHAV